MAKELKLDKKEKLAKSFIDLAFREHKGEWTETANRLLDAFKGKYYSTAERKERFTVNTIFSLVNLLLPNFIFNQPYIRVSPKQAKYYKKLSDGEFACIDSLHASQVREASLNHLYTKIGAIYEQRKAVQDSFFYGFGITKVGYSYDTISSEDKDFVVKDTQFLKRVNPKNFGWHPLATGMDDSPMLVERVLTTKSRLKKQKRFKGVDELVPEIPEFLKKKLKDKDTMINDYGFVTLYEVHDLENYMIYYFGGEGHKLMDSTKNPYDFTGPHFQQIKLAGDVDDFAGIPLLAMIEDEAVCLNEILTLIVEHYRKFPGAVFCEEGSIDEDAIERLKNGEQGSIHIVNSIDKMKFQNPLSMGSEYFNIVPLLNNLIDKILGVPDFQRAASSQRKTATEASFIQGDATVRREYFLQLIKSFMLDGIQKLADLQAQFQDETLEIQASGDLSGMQFKFDKEDIQGDFLFDFDMDSLRAYNEVQASNLNAALNVLGSHDTLKPILLGLSPDKLGKEIFKKLGMNIESFQARDGETNAVFFTPDKENAIARRDEPMPNPKKGEDHDYHLKIHGEDLKKNGINRQILDHMAQTMMLQQKEEAPPVTAQPPGMPPPGQPPGAPPQPGGASPAPNMSQNATGAPPGPQGPMQTPPGNPQ